MSWRSTKDGRHFQTRPKRSGTHVRMSQKGSSMEGMGRMSSRPSPSYPSGPIHQETLDSGDETTAHEIYLVESNDGELYRQRVEPTIHNYSRKMKNGTYDRERATEGLVNNLVPDAISRYKRDQGDVGPISHKQKVYIAKEWLPSIEEQAQYEAEHGK